MAKILAALILFLALPRTSAAAAPVSTSQETSVRRLGVSLIKSQVRDKRYEAFWNARRLDFQRNFVKFLNERSSVEGVPINREYGITEDNDTIVNNARQDGVDGVLGGEYQGHNLQLVLRSGSTGRPLLLLSVPYRDLRVPAWQIAKAAVDSLVNSIPYRGFIVAVAPSGKEAKINLGRNQGLKVGDRLEILDFEGENPTFSSPTRKCGELKVAKITNYAAIAQIVSTLCRITPFQKLSMMSPEQIRAEMPAPAPSAAQAPAAQVETAPNRAPNRRVSEGLWAALGAEVFFINTAVSDPNQANLLERQYQVPASPALSVGLGSSKLNFFFLGSSLSNSSNSVTFIQGTGTYQVYDVTSGKMSALTSVGLYYSQYSVTPSAAPTTLLIGTTTLAPVVEERFQWITGPKTMAFAGASLFYPVMSSDSLNGASSAVKSFGGGLEGGMRFDLEDKLGLEGGLKFHYLSSQLPNAASISELEANFFARVLFLF